MKSIIYLSQAHIDFNNTSLLKLSKSAQIKNHLNEITGFLYFQDGYFFQYIEGSEIDIDYLYSRIDEDSRHHIFCDLTTNGLSQKQFIGWDMEWLTQSDLSKIHIEQKVMDTLLGGPSTTLTKQEWESEVSKLIMTIARRQNELVTKR